MAVQHKMKLSNVDCSFLDYAPDYNIYNLPKELLDKLDNNIDILQNANTNINLKQDLLISPMMNMLSGLNEIKLKKPSENINSNSILNHKIINHSLPVPSLKEIQEAYQKLLKKNIVTNESEI